MMLADEDVEAIEEDDEGEEDQGGPGRIGLEPGLEHKGITINTLRFQCVIELDVGYADRAPGKQAGNGSQVLEPGKHLGWTARLDGEVREG